MLLMFRLFHKLDNRRYHHLQTASWKRAVMLPLKKTFHPAPLSKTQQYSAQFAIPRKCRNHRHHRVC